MATTYTSLWRLAILASSDPGTENSWGSIQDSTMPLMEQGAVGVIQVGIPGLTSYTLSTSNNASDQARYLVQQYTGALTGDCTVTVPNVVKVGWASNQTTGGRNVIISAGAGTTAVIPPDGGWYLYATDGATNAALVPFGISNIPGALTLSGPVTVSGSLTIPQGTTGNRAVNFSQFLPFPNPAGYIDLPGGVTMQWGNSTGPSANVTFPKTFSGAPWTIIATLKDVPVGGVTGFVEISTTYIAAGFTAYTVSAPSVGITANFFWLAIGPT